MRDEDGSDQRTLWCGNISEQVSDENLYELFLQAGPLESVKRPRDPNGRPKSFAFIVYKHECSVPYAVELFRGEKLYNRALNLQSRSTLRHIPVLDTHLSEYTDHSENGNRHRNRGRDHKNERRRSDKEEHKTEPSSWAELNALKGKGSLLNGHSSVQRGDLLGNPMYAKESKLQDNSAPTLDFETLMQMSTRMMPNMFHPGMLGGLPFPQMCSMGPPMANMYPSMQGGMSGGTRVSPERERRRNEYDRRGSRRDHPYQDKRLDNQHGSRRHSDNNYNHRRHDRGYSSSSSSHERERRDRRSR